MEPVDKVLDALFLSGADVDEAQAVLGHGAGELGTYNLRFDLQRAGIAGKLKIDADRAIAPALTSAIDDVVAAGSRTDVRWTI